MVNQLRVNQLPPFVVDANNIIISSPFDPQNTPIVSGMTGQEAFAAAQGQIDNIESGGSGVGASYTPAITINSGASSITDDPGPTGGYDGNNGISGGFIDVKIIFRVTTDSSNSVVDLTVSNPIGTAAQIWPGDITIVPVSPVDGEGGLGNPGNTSSGWFNEMTQSGILKINFEASQINTEYQVTAAWKYKIA